MSNQHALWSPQCQVLDPAWSALGKNPTESAIMKIKAITEKSEFVK